MSSSLEDKVVVTCALTGAVTTRQQCPALPYTPEEYAEETRRARDAGAAVVHIHAREDEGLPSFRKERYAEIARAILARGPIVLNFSTGAIGIPMEDRIGHIRDLRPDVGALNMGSMNYAKYSAKRKAFVFDMVFANPFRDITFLLEEMNKGGVKPELECFDGGHVGDTAPLIDLGLLRPPLDFNLILGVLGGMPASARNLAHLASILPSGSAWKVTGVSREQWRLVAAALALGGHVRVGLEDNFYLDAKGTVMVSSNAELVEKAVRMARDAGREPASVEEARRILGLPEKPAYAFEV